MTSVRHTAHLERDGHTRGSELRGDLFHPHRRREVEIEGNDLGQIEPDILVLDVHAAVDGDLHARIFARESDAPDVVEDLLRESDLHLLKVEDVAVHLDDDVVEDRLDKPHGVRDGFPGLGGGYLAHQLAACKLAVDLGDKLLILRRFRRSEQPRNGVLRLSDKVLDESAEEFIEIDAVHIEFARAEQSAEVGKEHLVLAAVSDARAHILCPCAREFDKQLGVGVVEHVDLRTDVQLQRPLQPVEIDLVVEDGGKAFPDFRIQTEESAEGVDEFVGSDAQLFECQIEGDREIESERRILRKLGDIDPSVGDEIALHVRHGEIGVIVPLYAFAAEGDVDAALLAAVDLLKLRAEGVEVHADAEVDRGKFPALAVVGGEIGSEIDGKILYAGKKCEIDAQDVLDKVIDIFGNQAVGTGSEQAAQHRAEQSGKRDGHGELLGAVGIGDKAGRSEEGGERAHDACDDALVHGEKVIENELCKTLVFVAAGGGEKFAQSPDHGSGIDVVRLDYGRTRSQTGAVVNEGGIVIIDTQKHLGKIAFRILLPQLKEDLIARVALKVDGGLHLERVGVAHRVFGVVQPDQDVGIDIMPGVRIGLPSGVYQDVPSLRSTECGGIVGDSGVTGFRRRNDGSAAALSGRVARRQDPYREAENKHEQ